MPIFRDTDSTPAERRAGHARPTALLCLSDRLAEGSLRVIRHLGCAFPGISPVVGFDDAAAALGLTAVRQPHRSKREQAGAANPGTGSGL